MARFQATLENTAFNTAELDLIDDMVSRLVSTVKGATFAEYGAGAGWYGYAQDFARKVAAECSITERQAAFIIAVTSNNVKWEQQLLGTVPLIKHIQAGGAPRQGPGRFIGRYKEAAARILAGDLSALSGAKVEVFAANILGDYSGVTVDRHAVRAAVGYHTDENTTTRWVSPHKFNKKGELKLNRKRAMLEAAYHEAARVVGIETAILQAVAWTVYRGSSGF